MKNIGILLLLFLPLTISAAAITGKVRLESFKSFLETRPNVLELLYSTEGTISEADVKAEPLLKKSIARGKPPGEHFARWEKNGSYYIHEGFNSDTLPDPQSGVVFGVKEGKCWQINGRVITTHETEDSESAILRKFLFPLLQTLDFGIPMLKDDTLSWDGDTFNARSQRERKIAGQLSLDDQGSPRELRCQLEGYKWSYVIGYRYAPDAVYPTLLLHRS